MFIRFGNQLKALADMVADDRARQRLEWLGRGTMYGPGRRTVITLHNLVVRDRRRQRARKLAGRHVW